VRLREIAEPPRQIELGTGRVLSGQEMARERARGVVDALYRGQRRRVAVDRYLTFLCRELLAAGDVTHLDTLRIRLERRLRSSSCLTKRGSQFWVKQWERQESVCRREWNAYVAALRDEAASDARYPATGFGPDMGPSAQDDLDAIAAAAAHHAVELVGGA
jgi:hypothetical protein